MRIFTSRSLFPSLLFAVLAACGSAKPVSETPRPVPATSDPSCPVAVPGTSVTVEDLDNGAALVFITTGDGGAKLLFVSGAGDVAKLQSELRMHAQHLASGTCAMGKS